MTDRLIIVESPAKANTIKKFLGGNTKVVASMGHIRDLPKSKIGIDINNDFEPEYINIRGKASLINSLKKDAKSAKNVYLATDPDREGEAIAWHLAYILGIPEDSICRITFNEITKEAVKEAVKKPRTIDINLTDAQQARRVLDRLVGYKISPVLWKKVKRGLSAGRVQSVALKLVCDREEEIEHFVPEEFWTITAIVKEAKTKKSFETKLVGKNKEKLDIHSKQEVDQILKDLEKEKYIVEDVTVGEKKRNPAPPFTTSTLQQEASRKLGFAIRKTMMVAQGLYEGVSISGHGVTGLITYMRTDSTRISDEARNAAKDVIIRNFGEEYYENRYFKINKESQDAHEAIRPTYLDLSPEIVKNDLNSDQYKLYTLIYNRFIASQMASAVYDTISVDINAGEYNFKTSGQSIKFKGFMTLYVEDTDEEKKSEELGIANIPYLEKQDVLKKESIDTKQSFTEPPPRYTEASLVKLLEEKGIGRPSTYSPIITTIITRNYIEKVQKQLIPTELGKIVNKLLVENFSDIINVEFTANMEKEFDSIAEGNKKWKELIREFYTPFSKVIEKVDKELEHVQLEYEETDEKCEKCGRNMVIKIGKYGKFLACPGYPECRNAKPLIEYADFTCPKCGSQVQIRKTKKRRNYYICENNPDSCDYISWNKPRPGEEFHADEELKKEVKKKTFKKITSKKKTTSKKKKATTKTAKKKSTKK